MIAHANTDNAVKKKVDRIHTKLKNQLIFKKRFSEIPQNNILKNFVVQGHHLTNGEVLLYKMLTNQYNMPFSTKLDSPPFHSISTIALKRLLNKSFS